MKKYVKSHEEHATTPLTISPNHNAWSARKLTKLLHGIEVGVQTFCVHKDQGLSYYADFGAWDRGSSYLMEKIKKDKKFVALIAREHKKIGTKLLTTIRQLECQDVNQFSNKKLAQILVSTYHLSFDFCVYGYVPVLSDLKFYKFTHLLKEIIKDAATNIAEDVSVSETVSLLSSPILPIPSREARKEFLQLLSSFKNKQFSVVDRKKLLHYYQKWSWVDHGQLGPRISLEKMEQDAQILLADKKLLSRELQELKLKGKKLATEQKEILNKFKLSAHDRYLFSVARTFMYLKGYRMEILFGVCAEWSRILNVMAKRVKIDKDLLYYCSVVELKDWLNKNKKMDIKILKERRKFCVWEADSEFEQKILTGKKTGEYLVHRTQIEQKGLENVMNLHGSVASVGYAKGVVKIVNKVSDINKVVTGDILVSVATNPALLPAMVKAAAFVTDEGGITSHAAIVAREMRKPCIIGTKIATQVLKDGDLIEVDTRSGDVRKV